MSVDNYVQCLEIVDYEYAQYKDIFNAYVPVSCQPIGEFLLKILEYFSNSFYLGEYIYSGGGWGVVKKGGSPRVGPYYETL